MDYRREGYRPSSLPKRMEPSSPSIMQSLDSISILEQTRHSEDKVWEGYKDVRPDVTLTGKFTDLSLNEKDEDSHRSFFLLNNEEHLQIQSPEQFSKKLGLSDNDTKLKIVSIFGNTGDGKSHTLNHCFFNGNQVFPTSAAQTSTTIGCWAAYESNLKAIFLDTEGLLGSTANENQRTRLLLKILAISDIVIYRTRAERLHHDLFTFLGSASRSFSQHFQAALQRVGLSTSLSALGPAAIIFHETKHTLPLQECVSESPEDYIRKRFADMNLKIDAFSSVRYIGTQTTSGITDYSSLKLAVRSELCNTSVRSPRTTAIVYNTLKVLNERFSGELESSPALFPDQYFTCPEKCLSCHNGCQSSMGHLKDNLPHTSSKSCVYQNQYDNYIYLCKKCHGNGIRQIVTPKSISNKVTPWYGLVKYVWSGYTIECSTCGELYSSRSYWYGNRPPEDCSSVRTELTHVWPGTVSALTELNTAQRVLDGVSFLSETVVGVVAQPTKLIGSYVADQIAPKYWRPNNEITHCAGCRLLFPHQMKKHHCRNCGDGFCEPCSSNYAPVPHHGWEEPVRVCNPCFKTLNKDAAPTSSDADGPSDVRVRRYGELLVNTFSSVATVLDYPKGIIKDSARPSYWVPDSEINCCHVCNSNFDHKLFLHHCRDCGNGVCNECSSNRRPVPRRGWEKPVRICDKCFEMD